ncbi:MAG: hypothetical protein C4582_05480 [Desulfobacteraceae bacterium]|nr:MAG: hypothetical protein C4582_05480 [Desulfobacteraceae bacterium]
MAAFSGYPRIGIYTGGGSSHSWLWFADLFERLGFWDLCFLDEAAVRQGALEHVDVLAVSGGDTFALAGALGCEGAGAVRRFVERGGIYFGSCAGAYLPMPSSKLPLNLFNFVDVRIANLASKIPPALRLREKFYTRYGCRYVFHPVREEILLGLKSKELLSSSSTIKAPLYGGPAMLPGEAVKVIASYKGFTEKTVFLTEEETCRITLIDKAAVVRCPLGDGCFYLFGPHLEHPRYPEANRIVGEILAVETGTRLPDGEEQSQTTAEPGLRIRSFNSALRRELGNARIVAAAMEFLNVRWIIGAKCYEPEKLRVFIEAMWRRLPLVEKNIATSENAEQLLSLGARTTHLLRELKTAVDEGRESDRLASNLFRVLRDYTACFLHLYFQTIKSLETVCRGKTGRLNHGLA